MSSGSTAGGTLDDVEVVVADGVVVVDVGRVVEVGTTASGTGTSVVADSTADGTVRGIRLTTLLVGPSPTAFLANTRK
jgi:hypothetical protein